MGAVFLDEIEVVDSGGILWGLLEIDHLVCAGEAEALGDFQQGDGVLLLELGDEVEVGLLALFGFQDYVVFHEGFILLEFTSIRL